MNSFKTQRQPAEVFCKIGVLRNFAKFTGKHPCQSLLFNKVADLRPATLLKKRLWHRCFPVNFAKFLKTPFITKHLWRLLLKTSIFSLFRSIHPEVFYINSAKFKGKHLRQRLFFNKAAGLSLQTLNKRRLCQRGFSMNFPKFLIEHF